MGSTQTQSAKAATTVVGVRTPTSTKTLVELAAAEAGQTVSRWAATRLRELALEQLGSQPAELGTTP